MTLLVWLENVKAMSKKSTEVAVFPGNQCLIQDVPWKHAINAIFILVVVVVVIDVAVVVAVVDVAVVVVSEGITIGTEGDF